VIVAVFEQHSVQKIFPDKIIAYLGRVRWWDLCRRL